MWQAEKCLLCSIGEMLSSLGKVDFTSSQPPLVTPPSTSDWGSSLLEAPSRASQNADDLAPGLGKPFLQKNPILIKQCQLTGLSINGNALYHTVQSGSH